MKKINSVEYTEVNKTLKKNINEQKIRKQVAKIDIVFQLNKNMKYLKPQLGRQQINSMKNNGGLKTSAKLQK